MNRRIVLRTAGVSAVAAAALALTSTAAFAVSDIGPGDTGQSVKCVQEIMNDLDNAKLTVDGDFGTDTKNAVKHYQSINDIGVDGIVGPDTGGDIKTTVYYEVVDSQKAGIPNATLQAWENGCSSLIPGSINYN